MTTFLISMPGGSEWVLIILAVLVLFGGRSWSISAAIPNRRPAGDGGNHLRAQTSNKLT